MILLWFRQDLRLQDNPALNKAVEEALATNQPLCPLYILDDSNAGQWAQGGASRWWLHHSLRALSDDLKTSYNLTLHLYQGDAHTILKDLCSKNAVGSLYWNRGYEPWRITRDTAIKTDLKAKDINAQSFNGSFLYDPASVRKKDGTPYKVFTPFYRKGCLEARGEPRQPEAAPPAQPLQNAELKGSLSLDQLELIPKIKWYAEMERLWSPGEKGAAAQWDIFIGSGLEGYKQGRDFPNRPHVSRLSPHLHFGEISPHRLWQDVRTRSVANSWETDGEHFLSELGWREFSAHLLYHTPDLPTENLQKKFDQFPWQDPQENDAIKRWQRGLTGYPFVDAGMRELWQTGYMHNRVRMIVGSFLVKHLRLHWQHGEAWFWDTLLDADLANNSASWQWIAGSGADAAPYFRIFNPITQGEKFDSDGTYIRRFVPELAKLPTKHLHAPWEAPKSVLQQAGVILGETYPAPIVDHRSARESALSAWSSLKTSG